MVNPAVQPTDRTIASMMLLHLKPLKRLFTWANLKTAAMLENINALWRSNIPVGISHTQKKRLNMAFQNTNCQNTHINNKKERVQCFTNPKRCQLTELFSFLPAGSAMLLPDNKGMWRIWQRTTVFFFFVGFEMKKIRNAQMLLCFWKCGTWRYSNLLYTWIHRWTDTGTRLTNLW